MMKNVIRACGLALVVAAPVMADTYSNGPLVCVGDETAGAGGLAASRLQTSLGLTIFGFGHQILNGNRAADDVTVPTGETWTVTGFSFYSYQTGSTTTTTTHNQVNVGVWSAAPAGSPGTGDVFPNTNFALTAANSKFSNIYRVLDTTLTNTQRPLFKNTVTLGSPLTFEGGKTYWIDWNTGGTLASGPWVPPVTELDKTNKDGANGLQFIAPAWAAALDTTFPQDFPFEIEYTKGGAACYPDCDGSGNLNIDDFICFQTFFAIGDPYADCDGSGNLNIDDFICFQTFYAIGC